MENHTDIDVLREMVRLAENRRAEMNESLERINRYNLALVAFSAGFLSLLVTVSFNLFIVQASGLLLLFSIFFSLLAIRPRTLKGVTLMIDQDVDILKKNIHIELREYLLVTAELTDVAATKINERGAEKKRFTILSAVSLALALITTYILYAYA